MGSRNRQGCCCGGTTPITCANVATVCGGSVGTSTYVKNGKVTDDNGVWSLTSNPGLNPANTFWTTAPIKFSTNKWTNGDCNPQQGDAYYSYKVTFSVAGGGVACELMYATQTCGAKTLYTGDKVSNGSQAKAKDQTQVACDPIGADFDFDKISGLAPPSLKATVNFDVDDAALHACGCRRCLDNNGYPKFSPLGDVLLTYSVDYQGLKKNGSVVLKKMDADSQSLHYGVTGSNVNLHLWAGNVDWWGQPSCSNPTNSKTGFNARFSCDSPTATGFLRWCGLGGGATSTPYLSPQPYTSTTDARNKLSFDLIDPGATPTKQGKITLTDMSKTGFDGVCCDPCILPKKDISMSVSGYGPSAAPSYGLLLKYREEAVYSSYLGNSFQWSSDTISQVFKFPLDPVKSTYPFYPGDDPNFPSPPIQYNKTYNYKAYMNCGAVYWSWIQDDGTAYTPRTLFTLDYLADTSIIYFGHTQVNQTEYTCEPFHFVNTVQSGANDVHGVFVLNGRTTSLDEVEP